MLDRASGRSILLKKSDARNTRLGPAATQSDTATVGGLVQQAGAVARAVRAAVFLTGPFPLTQVHYCQAYPLYIYIAPNSPSQAWVSSGITRPLNSNELALVGSCRPWVAKLPHAAAVTVGYYGISELDALDILPEAVLFLSGCLVRSGCTVSIPDIIGIDKLHVICTNKQIANVTAENGSKSKDVMIGKNTIITYRRMANEPADVSENVPTEAQLQSESLFSNEAVDLIVSNIELGFLYPKSCSKLNLTAPKGILISGMPGVGKTSAVRTAAAICNARLFVIANNSSIPEIQKIFDSAISFGQVSSKHSIIFIDEIVLFDNSGCVGSQACRKWWILRRGCTPVDINGRYIIFSKCAGDRCD